LSNPIEYFDRSSSSKVCRGDITRSPKELSNLYCYYVTNTTAFAKLARIKAEQASLDPFAIIFHDVIYDCEIEIIEKLSQTQVRFFSIKVPSI
jgi:prolyl 4-hydroxylase